MLNIIIKSCPIGLPLALNKIAVEPMSEAINVITSPLPKTQNAAVITDAEQTQSVISAVEK